MKNVHLLPTDKPSRLAGSEYITNEQGIDKRAFKLKLWNKIISNKDLRDVGYIPQNIYITSDEEIKEGDRDFYILANDRDGTWINRVEKVIECKIDPNHGKVLNLSSGFIYIDEGCKIILTTDPDLIAEGVQDIDNEFLEWFVKNPSCERVEVKKGFADGTAWGYNFLDYKIIIPQEGTFINPLIHKTMRNVHILPTDKPSRLIFSKVDSSYKYIFNNEFSTCNDGLLSGQKNIYITSDEEIKEGDYVIWNDKVYKDSKRSFIGVDYSQCKKIILTTDQDLIKDGIQPIDDDFLEWFVKNQSCEDIEISYGLLKPFQSNYAGYIIHLPDTDILEEPKQETLDKKSLYIQDYKSRISALQYVIDFYEILTKEDIVKQKDDYSKQLKDLENE